MTDFCLQNWLAIAAVCFICYAVMTKINFPFAPIDQPTAISMTIIALIPFINFGILLLVTVETIIIIMAKTVNEAFKA